MGYSGSFVLWVFTKPNGNRRNEETDGHNEESVAEDKISTGCHVERSETSLIRDSSLRSE
jgi:hypothetical protein